MGKRLNLPKSWKNSPKDVGAAIDYHITINYGKSLLQDSFLNPNRKAFLMGREFKVEEGFEDVSSKEYAFDIWCGYMSKFSGTREKLSKFGLTKDKNLVRLAMRVIDEHDPRKLGKMDYSSCLTEYPLPEKLPDWHITDYY